MEQKKIPLLLTSSVIAHDVTVTLKDTDARIRLTIESLVHWLRIDPSLDIVLCDGSNFDFSDLVRKQFPSAHIECLHFENDQGMVKLRGRGYGEGEIIRYALENSRLIQQAGAFAKCTSKLWVENYKQCLQNWNGRMVCKAVFTEIFSLFRPTQFSYIDTRFYIASCDFYKKYFLNLHFKIGSKPNHSLEEYFQEAFVEHDIRNALFNVNPVICGVGGGTGVYYKNPIKRKIKETLKLKMVRNKQGFRQLFVQE